VKTAVAFPLSVCYFMLASTGKKLLFSSASAASILAALHLVRGVAQRLERRSLAGRLHLIYAWSIVDM